MLNGCRDNTLGVVQRVAKDFSERQLARISRSHRQGRRAHRGSQARAAGGFDRLCGRRRRDAAAGVSGSGEKNWRGGLRHRLALAARRGHPSVAGGQPPVRQPRVSFHRATAVLDEHPRHAMRREGDETRGRGKNPSDAAHRRHGVRHQPALLDQARGLQHSGSADGMDGQGRFEGRAGAFVVDDVFVRRAGAADLFAVLQVAPAVAPAWRRGFTKNYARRSRWPDRRFRKSENSGWRIEGGWQHLRLPFAIFHFPSSSCLSRPR